MKTIAIVKLLNSPNFERDLASPSFEKRLKIRTFPSVYDRQRELLTRAVFAISIFPRCCQKAKMRIMQTIAYMQI
jgi:hypothetical protein